MFHLFEVPLWHRMPFDAIAGWPLILRKIVGAEQPVEQWKMNRKVYVDRLALNPMVPMMEARSNQDFLNEGKPPIEVGMHKRRVEIHRENIAVHCRRAEAEHKHRQHGGTAQCENF